MKRNMSLWTALIGAGLLVSGAQAAVVDGGNGLVNLGANTLQYGDTFLITNGSISILRPDTPNTPSSFATIFQNNRTAPAWPDGNPVSGGAGGVTPPGTTAAFYSGGKFDSVTGDLYFNIGYDSANYYSGYNSHSGFALHKLSYGGSSSTVVVPDLAATLGLIPAAGGFSDIAAYNGTIYTLNSSGNLGKVWESSPGVWSGQMQTGNSLGLSRAAGTLRVTPDGKYVIATSGDSWGAVAVWDTTTLARTAYVGGGVASTNSGTRGVAFGGIADNGNLILYLNNAIRLSESDSNNKHVTVMELDANGNLVNPYAGNGNIPGNTADARSVVTWLAAASVNDSIMRDADGNIILMDRANVFKLFTPAQLALADINVTSSTASSLPTNSGPWTYGQWAPNHIDMNLPIPEPATLSLLALGGLMMVTRRSK